MTDLTNYRVTDGIDDVLAAQYNRVIDSIVRGELSNTESLAANKTLTSADYALQVFTPTAARDVTLPAVGSTNHPYYIINASATYALTVKNAGGSTIGIVPISSAAMFASNATAWYMGNMPYVEPSTSGNILTSNGTTWVSSTPAASIPYVVPGTSGNVLTSDGSSWTSAAPTGGELPNLIINGGFDFAQRQTPSTLTARANDTYCADRWNLLTNGGATDIQYARTTGDTASSFAGQLKQVNATAKYFGLQQIVESKNSIPLRGQTVIFQFRAKSSANRNMRAAIVEWTGTADAVTSDIVNNWASTTYTTGNFFKSTTTTVTAVSASLSATTSYATFSISGTISASATNVIVFVWSESTVAQNATVDITQAGLYISATIQTWKPRPYGNELLLCQRFYEKSWDTDTAPTSAISTGRYEARGTYAAAAFLAAPIRYKVEKINTPTVTCYDANGLINKISYITSTAGAQSDNQTLSVDTVGTSGCRFLTDNTTVKLGIICHWTIEAEL